jgi:histone chaperone ASF1
MSLVNVLNVQVLDNPSTFQSSFQFDITFECIAPLEQDLEWKIIYVGSAESERYDQVLDSIMVGPISVGINKFVFEAAAPNPALIPVSELVGVTVVLLTCSYLDQEFVRVGYYVDNNYEDTELRENPPVPPKVDILKRNILADKPRVTRFDIKWDSAKLGEQVPQELLDVHVNEENEDLDMMVDGEEEDDEGDDEDEDDDEEASGDEEDSETDTLSIDDEEYLEGGDIQPSHPSSSLMDVDPVPTSRIESLAPSPTYYSYEQEQNPHKLNIGNIVVATELKQ